MDGSDLVGRSRVSTLAEGARDAQVHCLRVGYPFGAAARNGPGRAGTAQDDNFALIGGLHLDSGKSASRMAQTNALGLAFHACWRSSAREAVGAVESTYTFILDNGSTDKLTVTVETIPDMPWVLLSQIASGAS